MSVSHSDDSHVKAQSGTEDFLDWIPGEMNHLIVFPLPNGVNRLVGLNWSTHRRIELVNSVN